MKLGTQLNIAQ